MKKYRLAITGVFDLENYGDLLFPIVFEKAMIKKGLEFELYLFSVNSGEKALDINTQVYSLDDLESMHLENPFDAIIIGGGALIHFNKIYQINPNGMKEFKEYSISKTWVIPSIIAARYNINLLWNVPGVPYKISQKFKEFVNWCCAQANYLSVRNNYSKDILEDLLEGEQKIHVFPDSVLSISDYFTKENLGKVRDDVIKINSKYVVFHANRHIPNDEIGLVIEALNFLKNEGYEVVLLPLAYTHNDQEILEKINKQSNNKYITFNRKLNVIEMISILQGCELYIGVSFHGVITAASYSKKVISYNYMKYEKSEQLLKLLGKERYHIENAQNIKNVVQEVLNDNNSINRIDEIKNDCNQHFEYLYSNIIEPMPHSTKGPSFECMNELYRSIELNCELEGCMKSNEYLQSQVEYYKGIIEGHIKNDEYLQSQVNYYKGMIEDLKNRERHNNEKYLYLEKSSAQTIEYQQSKIEYLEQLAEHLKSRNN